MNLVEILKDVPIGTKLYSPIYGECEFVGIDNMMEFPIRVRPCYSIKNGWDGFTKHGKKRDCKNAECLLFPSKENRDWSTFKVPKSDLPSYTPCICFNDIKDGALDNPEFKVPINPVLRYYAGNHSTYCDGCVIGPVFSWKYIIPTKKYDFENRTFDNEDNYGEYDKKG